MSDEVTLSDLACVGDVLDTLHLLRHLIHSVVIDMQSDGLATVTFVTSPEVVNHLADVATASCYAVDESFRPEDEPCDAYLLEGEVAPPDPKRTVH